MIANYRGRIVLLEEVIGRRLTARPWSNARQEWRPADDFPLDSFDLLEDVTARHGEKLHAPQIG